MYPFQLQQISKKTSRLSPENYIKLPKKIDKIYILKNTKNSTFDLFLTINGYYDVDIMILYHKNKNQKIILDLLILNDSLHLMTYSDRLSILQSKQETENIKIITRNMFSTSPSTFYRPLSDSGLTLTKVTVLDFKIRCIVGEFTNKKRYFLLADDCINDEFIVSCVATYQYSVNVIKGKPHLKVRIPKNITNYILYSKEIYVKCVASTNTVCGLPLVTNMTLSKSKALDKIIPINQGFKPKPNNKTLKFLKKVNSDLLMCELACRNINTINVDEVKLLEYKNLQTPVEFTTTV